MKKAIRGLLALALAAPMALPMTPAVAAQDEEVNTSRELAGIAEEQALLRRQLQRLRNTMEVLLERIEAEGRTRTAELLREGLKLLDERAPANGETPPLTLEELMEVSKDSIEHGQLVQSLERQEALIGNLERLLSILMDRKNLEALEESIEELRDLQASLEDLVNRERELRGETEELRQKAASEEQRALEAEIARLLAEQRALLDANENLGRESGTMELELLERELEQLIEDQRTDSELLAAWDPNEEAELSALEALLDQARASEARAARLAEAAELLREVASGIEQSTPESEFAPFAESLANAAEREERHERVSGDPAAAKSAAALREGAELVRDTDLSTADPEPRNQVAERLRELAEELEDAATGARAPAGESREQALRELGSLAERDTAGGQVAKEVQEALEKAVADDRAGRKAEAAEATDEAARKLSEGTDELDFLSQALARSQADSAERAGRIARGLETLAPGKTPAGEKARGQLGEASQKMKEASQAARQNDAFQAGQSADEALEALKEAAAALAEARDEAAREVAERAREGARDQGELAQETESLAPQASEGSMNPVAEEQVKSALEEAAQAMQQASESLSQGKSASAANSQRQAMDALQRAQASAMDGVTPTNPEDRKRAEELAQKQEEIREDILDLARRAEERKNAQPLPSLDNADQAAQQATSSLNEGDLSQAEREEEEVERELEQALEDLREEEEAYERLRQEEILFRIAEEVANMIEVHREQMAQTKEIDAAREPSSAPSRSQKLRLRRIAREEEALATRAGEMALAIAEEQSEVTAELMRLVQGDLNRIARDLSQEGDFRTGDRVQTRQRDVEESLEWLLEALKQEQQRRQQQQQPPQQQGPPPLVPDVTELKLLRRMELEVQDGVDRLLIQYPELENPEDVDPLVLEEILRWASRHERITELFQNFRERVGLPAPEEVED